MSHSRCITNVSRVLSYLVTLMFDEKPSLDYLGLSPEYHPSPRTDPISFLKINLTKLPPHLLLHYSSITTPKQRAAIPTVRNRRLIFTNQNPPELQFISARKTWPLLWKGRERRGIEEGAEERDWAENNFLQGAKKHVGKLASLLGGYEEEREAERIRVLYRERPASELVAEEDDESDEETEEEAQDEARETFEYLVREHFIYGLLKASNKLKVEITATEFYQFQDMDYDKVDWDDTLDDDREAEDQWFNED
jgi:hypothetical protein